MAKTVEQRVADLEKWATGMSNWFHKAPDPEHGAAWPWLKDHDARIKRLEPKTAPRAQSVPPPPTPPTYP